MSSNYMFAFRRSALAAPAAPAALAAPAAAPKAPNAPNAQSADRFSLNRLMNYKATGGCRSCG